MIRNPYEYASRPAGPPHEYVVVNWATGERLTFRGRACIKLDRVAGWKVLAHRLVTGVVDRLSVAAHAVAEILSD